MKKVDEILFSPLNNVDRESFIFNYSSLKFHDIKYLHEKILSDKLSPIFLEYFKNNNLIDVIDEKELKKIIYQAQIFQVQNLQIVKEIIFLSKIFKKANLNPIFLKGSALINEYNDLSSRAMVDIDILFNSDELFDAYNILKKNNFRELRYKSLSEKDLLIFSKNVHHLPELVGDSNISIELHHRLTKFNDFEECPIAESIFSNNRKINFFGENINIPSIEEVITHQLIHFSLNAKYTNQLRTFYDLKQIEENYKIDWFKILSKNKNLKIKKTLTKSLAVINRYSLITNSFNKLRNELSEYFPKDETVDYLVNETLKVHKNSKSNYFFEKIYIFLNLIKSKNIFKVITRLNKWIFFKVRMFFKLKR